jgi:hypothetical protein
MPEKEVGGEFAKEDGERAAHGKRSVAAARQASCKKLAKASFTEQLPAIIAALTFEAKGGSVQHLKVLLQLAGLDKPKAPAAKRKGKSLEAILREQWRKDDEDEAAREAAREAKRAEEDAAEVARIGQTEQIDPLNQPRTAY